jgi:predicted metal-dependent phosphoesterase TrpH
MKADLHVHTCYSADCCTPLKRVVDQCLKKGIGCLAVSDHNTIAGAVRLRKMAPFPVIVAEEIRTSKGELMGLFLSNTIPAGLSPEETIAKIREQGGLVCIPHPFGRWFLGNSRDLLSTRILSQVDIVEVFNSRTPFPGSSGKARSLALKYGKIVSAGSDAHTPGEIGRAYVEMPEFNDSSDFLSCLSQGRVIGQTSSPIVHISTTWARVRKRLC